QPFSSQQSFVKLIKEYPRLVVMRTLSKVGLAALRSGFIVAQKDIIDEVNKARLPFNVNSLSQAVAMQALGNRRKFQDFVNAVVEERHLLFDSLDRLEGVQPFPTDANFILFRVNNAEKVYKMLLARGVLVRNVSDAVKGCLRVTVGRPEENRIFVNELSKILKRV
ncbi:MAG TPA: aminotransferase class I/II-fold pyridoxal phosphate-dependent enzyme, partial [Nitrospirae bacterium]|nr:aminotransferase class I/II-fold pyridoxal phosphate-dependent enzyme [Nitrospirota bacterium]